MADDKALSSFLAGGPVRELSSEELREKFGFLVKMMRRLPTFSDDAVIDQTLARYHQIREMNASASFTEGELPGWRAVVLDRRNGLTRIAGVHDSGLVFQGAGNFSSVPGLSALQQSRVLLKDVHELGHGAAYHLDWDDELDDLDDLDDLGEETFGERVALDEITDVEAIEAPSGGRSDQKHSDLPGGNVEVRDSLWVSLSAYSGDVDYQARDRAGRDTEKLLAPFRLLDDYAEDDPREKDRRQLFKMTSNALRKLEARRLGSLFMTCRRALDPEVSKIMSACLMSDALSANVLSGIQFSKGGYLKGRSETAARNRQQAVKSYPVLGRALITRRDPREKLSIAVDRGGELSRALAEQYGISPAHLRRLNGLTWQKAGRDAYKRPEVFMDRLRHVDVNHIPGSRRGFADMAATINAADELSRTLGHRGGDIVASVGGRFEQMAKALEGNPATGVMDMKRDIFSRVFRPALAQGLLKIGYSRESASQTARAESLAFGSDAPQFLAGHSMRSALTASERWHRARPRIANEVGDGSQFQKEEYGKWDPLVGQMDLGDGITAFELSSLGSLRDEGVKQNHCVGGYGPQVKSGKTLIFSLRRNDETLSTVEIKIEGEKDKTIFSVGQNFGYDNEDPSSSAQRAASRLLKRLGKVETKELSAYRSELRKLTHDEAAESMNVEAGYDIFDRKGLEQAYATMKEFLPKKDAKLSLDQWMEKTINVDELVRVLPPSRRAAGPEL